MADGVEGNSIVSAGNSIVSAAFDEGYKLALKHVVEYARAADQLLPANALKGLVPEALEIITAKLEKVLDKP